MLQVNDLKHFLGARLKVVHKFAHLVPTKEHHSSKKRNSICQRYFLTASLSANPFEQYDWKLYPWSSSPWGCVFNKSCSSEDSRCCVCGNDKWALCRWTTTLTLLTIHYVRASCRKADVVRVEAVESQDRGFPRPSCDFDHHFHVV